MAAATSAAAAAAARSFCHFFVCHFLCIAADQISVRFRFVVFVPSSSSFIIESNVIIRRLFHRHYSLHILDFGCCCWLFSRSSLHYSIFCVFITNVYILFVCLLHSASRLVSLRFRSPCAHLLLVLFYLHRFREQASARVCDVRL